MDDPLFLAEMAEILEADNVMATDRLDGFAAWDSLAIMSVIAMADAMYGVNLAAQEVRKAHTVQSLYDLIMAKRLSA